MASDNFVRYQALRREYPYFSYESYDYNVDRDHFNISFVFDLAGRARFSPGASIPVSRFEGFPELLDGNRGALDNLVFHIGLIELISYWKTACPPLILVKPFVLQPEQLKWWKDLYFKGMAEFFYVNGISPRYEEFVRIESRGNRHLAPFGRETFDGKLVPVGGGKDSAVTLQLLLDQALPVVPFIMNPRKAINETIEAAGLNPEESLVVHRTLDPLMLEMNEKGFLNGHTPFSALLAFYSLLGSYISRQKDIVLSNEASANEPTIPGTDINHQWSKSFEFESAFRSYTDQFISPAFNYYSLLRPLNELQISKIFSGMEKFHKAFRSCNVGSKENKWCGKCPKCLFTWVILSPFLGREKLSGIFGKDLSHDLSLAPVLDQLTGTADEKPFECVGTVNEVNAALGKLIREYPEENLPPLLDHYRQVKGEPVDPEEEFSQVMDHIFEEVHFIPDTEISMLKIALKNA